MTSRLARVLIIVLAFTSLCFAQDQQTWKIRQYDLRIAPNFKTHTVAISTTMEIDNPRGATDFQFAVRPPFKVTSATTNLSVTGSNVRDDVLSVYVPKGARRVQVKTTTTIDPNAQSRSEQRAVVDDDSLFLIWSDAFYPNTFDDWAPVHTTLVLPEGYEGIGPGHFVSRTKRRDGTVEIVYDSRLPQVNFSVFADRKWKRTSRIVNGLKMTTLLFPESQKWSEQIFRGNSEVLRYFADLHGVMPFEEFSFVTLNGMYGRRCFSGFVGYPPNALENEMIKYGYDAHETSLLWWGHTTHASGKGAWQWNEGFGDYVEIMFVNDMKKPRPEIFDRFRNMYLESDFAQEPLYTELRGNTPQKWIHGKYPWLMRVLEQRIGEEAFRRGIRALFSAYRFRTYTFDEMVTTFERASGHKLDWWRKDWVERRGVPQVGLEYSIVRDTGGFVVRGRIEQKGSSYSLPLDIALKTGTTTLMEKLNLNAPEASFEFRSATRPSEVILDPENRYLMKKSVRAVENK